jgi:eukaryotic-like serine/threonine-protein kinase
MALANVACLLGQDLPEGQRVLTIDWDLEAPGLHYYLGSVDERHETPKRPGVVELFTRLAAALPDGQDGDNTEGEVDAALDALGIASFIYPTRVPNVDLMPAGCMDDTYQSRVTKLDWEDIYKRSPTIYGALARWLTREYAVVLVDSRTGMTDISGVCTALLPDKLVVVFTPNQQSLTGIEALVRRSTEYRQGSSDLRPLMVYPLPSRIDNQFETLRALWRHGDTAQHIEGYQVQFERILTLAYALPKCNLSTYFEEVQIQHSPEYSYGEPVAAMEPLSSDRFSIVRSYRALVDWLQASAAPWEGLEEARARGRLASLKTELTAAAASPVVQETRRQIELLDEAVALSRSLRGAGHPETVTLIEQLVGILVENADDRPRAVALLDELAQTLDSSTGPPRWGIIECLLQSAGSLQFLGESDAGRLRSIALAAVDSTEDARSPYGLSILVGVENRLREQGKLSEAKEVLDRLLATQRLLLGPAHPATLTSMIHLASIFKSRGDLPATRSVQEEVLTLTKQALGEDHVATVSAMRNLALTLQAQGELAEAQALQQEALDICARTLGRSDATTLALLNDITTTLQARGALAEAREFQEHVLKMSTEIFGQDHPVTLLSMHNLASIRQSSGDPAGALALQEQLVKQARRTLGDRDPNTLQAMTNLGVSLQDRGDLAGALAVYEEAHSIVRSMPPGHAESRRTLAAIAQRIGDVRLQQGELVAAAAAFNEAREIAIGLALRDPGNSLWVHDLWLILLRIGDVQMQQGDFAAAGGRYAEAAMIARSLMSRDPGNAPLQRDLSVALLRVGDAHEAQRHLPEALTTYQEAMTLARTLASRDPDNSVWQRTLLVSLLRAGDVGVEQGEQQMALAAYDEATAVARSMVAKDRVNRQWQRDLSIALTRVGDSRALTDELEAARTAYEEAMALLQELSSQDPANAQWQRDVVMISQRLAALYEQLGDISHARALQEDVVDRLRRSLGEEHQDTQMAMSRLASTLLLAGEVTAAARLQEELAAIQKRAADRQNRYRVRGTPDV